MPLATGSATVAYVRAEGHVIAHLIKCCNWIDIEARYCRKHCNPNNPGG